MPERPIDRVTRMHYAVYTEGLDEDPPEPATAKELRQAAMLLARNGMIGVAVELSQMAVDREG